MKIYHYTSSSVWDSIQAKSDGALCPSEHRVLRNPDTRHEENALFSFQDRAPYEWLLSKDFAGEFSFIATSKSCAMDPTRKLVCLSAEIEEDKLWVSDYAEYYRRDLSSRFNDDTAKYRAITAYFESLTPIRDYKRGSHELPEVICFSPIPKANLSVETQFTPTDDALRLYMDNCKAEAQKSYRAHGCRMAPPCYTP
jgi:hypothetical protein